MITHNYYTFKSEVTKSLFCSFFSCIGKLASHQFPCSSNSPRQVLAIDFHGLKLTSNTDIDIKPGLI